MNYGVLVNVVVTDRVVLIELFACVKQALMHDWDTLKFVDLTF